MDTVILRTREAIHRWLPALRQLAAQSAKDPDLTRFPEYFLASLQSRFRPSVVVCREHGLIIGAVYGAELLLLGQPTGWVLIGDEMGRGAVVCDPNREPEVMRSSCEHLLRNGIHAIRARWAPAADVQSEKPLVAYRDAVVSDFLRRRPMGDSLQLPHTYEDLLNAFGSHTRRNLRYYRRKAEDVGIHLVSIPTEDGYEKAVEQLRALADFNHPNELHVRDHQFFQLAGEPIWLALQTNEGKYVAVLSAVQFGSNIHVLSQLNDGALKRLSISLVLRSHLLEEAIRRRCRAIHFVNGASPMLGRYCAPIVLHVISIDKRMSLFHPVKLAAANLASRPSVNAQVPMRIRALLGQNFFGAWTFDEPI